MNHALISAQRSSSPSESSQSESRTTAELHSLNNSLFLAPSEPSSTSAGFSKSDKELLSILGRTYSGTIHWLLEQPAEDSRGGGRNGKGKGNGKAEGRKRNPIDMRALARMSRKWCDRVVGICGPFVELFDKVRFFSQSIRVVTWFCSEFLFL